MSLYVFLPTFLLGFAIRIDFWISYTNMDCNEYIAYL